MILLISCIPLRHLAISYGIIIKHIAQFYIFILWISGCYVVLNDKVSEKKLRKNSFSISETCPYKTAPKTSFVHKGLNPAMLSQIPRQNSIQMLNYVETNINRIKRLKNCASYSIFF